MKKKNEMLKQNKCEILFDVNTLADDFLSEIRSKSQPFLSFHLDVLFSIFLVRLFAVNKWKSQEKQIEKKLGSEFKGHESLEWAFPFCVDLRENHPKNIFGQIDFELKATKPSWTNTKSINSSVLMLHKWLRTQTINTIETNIVCWCFLLIKPQNITWSKKNSTLLYIQFPIRAEVNHTYAFHAYFPLCVDRVKCKQNLLLLIKCVKFFFVCFVASTIMKLIYFAHFSLIFRARFHGNDDA